MQVQKIQSCYNPNFKAGLTQKIANEINSLMEIASLTGNVTTMNGEAYVHLHAVLCDKEGNAFGGHLKKGVIGATCEIFVSVVDGEVSRVNEKETGLNILDI
mgnify:CR=1 FL=1